MPTFNAEISLPVRGSSLLSFNLSKCTGSGVGCTSLTSFQNVLWTRFPIIIPNLEYGVITHIQLIVNRTNGKCPTGTTINLPIGNIPTPTPTVTPTLTVTPTHTLTLTPTLTPTLTITPTFTPTPTLTITPTPDTTVYYWYALGDCSDMRYTYTQVTNTGMGIINIPGLCGLPSAMDYSDPAHTAYYFDTSNPCGFGTGYTGVYNARSSTQLTEGDVYTISGTCYSIIELNSEPPTWTINMDGRTKETGDNPCFDCQPPFTGFTYYTYSGVTCGNNDQIIVYDISPYVLNSISPQIGQLYLYHEYDVSGTLVNPGNRCVEITGYIGEFVGPKVVVPLPGAISGSTYSVPVGPILTGGGEINDCTECIPHWNITTVRCDGQIDLIGYPIFGTTKPAIDSVIKTNANDGICRKVTEVFPLKFIPYLGGYIGNMHTQIYYVSSSYDDCPTCTSGEETPVTCNMYYNNSFETLEVDFQSCTGTWYYNELIQVGESICIIEGSQGGADWSSMSYTSSDCG